jgi:hypothetical protein
MSTSPLEKYVLIRPHAYVDDALKMAARRRGAQKVELIERLLTVIVTDNLINAVLDDNGSGEWRRNERSRLPT